MPQFTTIAMTERVVFYEARISLQKATEGIFVKAPSAQGGGEFLHKNPPRDFSASQHQGSATIWAPLKPHTNSMVPRGVSGGHQWHRGASLYGTEKRPSLGKKFDKNSSCVELPRQ